MVTHFCKASVLALLVLPAVMPQQFKGTAPVSLLDAIQSALRSHPALRSAEQALVIRRAQKEIVSAAFDPVLAVDLAPSHIYSPQTPPDWFRDSKGKPADTIKTYSFNTALSSSTLLRNGISVTPFNISIERQTNNGAASIGENLFSFHSDVNVPLLRGRGSVTTGPERQAILEVDASRLDLHLAALDVIRAVASSYWTLVAAERLLAAATESEERGAVILNNAREMVKADQSPEIDLRSAAANLADRKSTRIAAEQAESTSRTRLMLDMGLSVSEMTARIVASDSLPDPSEIRSPIVDSAAAQALIGQALANRPDYRAALTRIQSSQIGRDVAKNQLLPQLDLRILTGYSGLNEGTGLPGYFSSLGTRVHGPDIQAGIRYSFPHYNRAAQNRLIEAGAQLSQQRLSAEQTARTIASLTISSLETIRTSFSRAQRAHESATEYRAALEGEEDKLKLGLGSIVTVLTVEDRLTTALQNEIQAELVYLQAIIDFRYASGTLVTERSGGGFTVDPDNLATTPLELGKGTDR